MMVTRFMRYEMITCLPTGIATFGAKSVADQWLGLQRGDDDPLTDTRLEEEGVFGGNSSDEQQDRIY